MSKAIASTFTLGDRVQPTSGPYRRKDFIVVGTTGDKIQVESDNLKLSFPPKLLKLTPLRKEKTSGRPKTITVTGVEVADDAISDRPKLSVGDLVAGVWAEDIVGVVKAIHPSGRVLVQWSDTCEIEFFESALILVPPEKDPEKDPVKESRIEVGESFAPGVRVSFTQQWWGKETEFEGEVIKLHHPPGTAIVRYRAPDVARELEIKAPIGIFTLRKDDCPELSLLEKVLLHEALGEVPPESDFLSGGAVAPSGCWIERKVHSGGWTEAAFKSRTAIFPAKRGGGMAKSRYIGKWGSPAHSAAIEAVKRRNDLEKQKRWSEKC